MGLSKFVFKLYINVLIRLYSVQCRQHQYVRKYSSLFLIFTTFTPSLGKLIFVQSLRLQHSKGLHPLEVSFSVIVSIEVTISILPRLVDHQVPSSGSSSGNSCSNDQVLLNLGDMHATHNRLSNLGNCRHGEFFLSLVEVNQ